MKRKVLSLALVSLVVLSFGGCQLGGKYTEKKAAAFFEKELDGEEIDVDDFLDALEDEDIEEFEDGEWTCLDKKQTRKAYDALELEMNFGSFKKADSSVCYMVAEKLKNGRTVTMVMSLTFENKEDIDDFFEDTLDVWEESEDRVVDYVIDEGDNEILFWGKNFGIDYYRSLYRDGKNVLLIISVDDDDTVDDVCEYFGISSPVDLEE